MKPKIIPILHEIKKYLKSKQLDYFEIRFEKQKIKNITIDNLSVKDLIENESEGVGIRIIVNNRVGFLSLNKLDNYRVEINKLIENTKKTNKKIEFENYSKIKDKDIIKYKSFEDIDNSKKIDELIKLNKNYYKKNTKDLRILKSEIIYNEIEKEKYFLTNDAEIYQKRPYIITYSILTGKRNNQIETNLNRQGYLGGLEKTNLKEKEKLIKDNQVTLKELLESKPCPATKSDLILHPSVTDLLAHEAIGHSCEGDSLIDNITVLKKGLKVSNNLAVNVVDNPEMKEFGYFKYDDEGIKAKKVDLIKKGIVNSFMTDITSATKLKEKSNGSARAESYNSMPIVRMSNTYFKPGNDKIEDILKGFNGYLLSGFQGGQVDPNIGTFMFGIKQAYKYQNGKIIEKYKQASIAGNIVTYLNKISEISNKIDNFEIGFCGKGGQKAFVSGTGPYLKINDATLGGTKHE